MHTLHLPSVVHSYKPIQNEHLRIKVQMENCVYKNQRQKSASHMRQPKKAQKAQEWKVNYRLQMNFFSVFFLAFAFHFARPLLHVHIAPLICIYGP